MRINCPTEFHKLIKKNKPFFRRFVNNFLIHQTDKNFSIKKVKNGIYPAIITINGLHTQHSDNASGWMKDIFELHPNNIWFEVCWDSKTKWDWLKKPNITELYNFPWSIALRNAELAGERLYETLISCPTNAEYIFYGHSLGARVIYNCLKRNITQADTINIIEVNLFGGAIPNDVITWEKSVGSVNGKIYNYFSQYDDVLNYAYKIGSAGIKPIGNSEIKMINIENVNVSHIVDGHSKYIPNLKSCVNRKNIFTSANS